MIIEGRRSSPAPLALGPKRSTSEPRSPAQPTIRDFQRAQCGCPLQASRERTDHLSSSHKLTGPREVHPDTGDRRPDFMRDIAEARASLVHAVGPFCLGHAVCQTGSDCCTISIESNPVLPKIQKWLTLPAQPERTRAPDQTFVHMSTGSPRRDPRRRTFKAGRIVFNNGASVIDCVVRNTSAGGAALDVPSTAGIPAEFVLVIAGEPNRACTITWKRAGKIGVRFC